MRASEWEFRHRFWIYAGIFTFAYALYAVYPQNVVSWIAHAWRRAQGLPMATPTWVYRAVFASAAALAALGAWLRTWAAAYLHSEVVHDAALHDERIVADGPYRHLRNPLYVGLLLSGLGLATLANPMGAAVMLVGLWLFTLRLIGREEAALLARGGESYRAFCAAVPRLLPALTPRLPPSGAPPRWGQALLGETFFWALAAALVVFAVTLRTDLYLGTIGLAFVLRGILAMLWWRRKR
jgi:protein-S-isoprenylcysteine O-methyltransferase Ste14